MFAYIKNLFKRKPKPLTEEDGQAYYNQFTITNKGVEVGQRYLNKFDLTIIKVEAIVDENAFKWSMERMWDGTINPAHTIVAPFNHHVYWLLHNYTLIKD